MFAKHNIRGYLDNCSSLIRQIDCDHPTVEKREAAEDRTFTNSNLSAAVQNLTGSFWLLKALLIYWIHVSISTIYLISMYV